MNDRRAILFDLDGTLVDLNPQTSELELLRTKILNHAKILGITTRNKSIFDTYQLVLEQCGFHHPTTKAMRLDLDAFEVRCALDSAVVKCQRPNIKALRELGVCVGIVTSNGLACLQALFEKQNLEKEWIDLVVTRDDSAMLKPSPIPIEVAIGRAKHFRPNLLDVWFVGDSARDKEAVDQYNRTTLKEITFIKVSSNYPIEAGNPDRPIDDVLLNLSKEFKE